MKHEAFLKAVEKLGLRRRHLARMLGVTQQHVNRLFIEPHKPAHRNVSGSMERLLKAYLDGYRPRDWPDDE